MHEKAGLLDALIVSQQALTRYALDSSSMTDAVFQAYRDEYQQAKQRLDELDAELKTLSFSDDDVFIDEARESGTTEQRTPNTLTLTKLSDLLNEPEEQVSWLVDKLLPAGGFSLLVAKPKAGKSWWQGGQSLAETLQELNAPPDVWRRYCGMYSKEKH